MYLVVNDPKENINSVMSYLEIILRKKDHITQRIVEKSNSMSK